MEKGIASLKRLMSFTRQMPQMPGRGQQRGERTVGETYTGNCSHSSMSGMVRRCPPHGNNCSRRTRSPGGHWSLAEGWAATCPSHPAPGSLREECARMESAKDSARTSQFSVSQKGCHRLFAPTNNAPRSDEVWGKMHTTAHSWRFIRLMRLMSTCKALRSAL